MLSEPTVAHSSSMTRTLAWTYTGVPSWFSKPYMATRPRPARSKHPEGLVATHQVRDPGEPTVLVRVQGEDGYEQQSRLCLESSNELSRHFRGPKVLVFNIDEAPGRPSALIIPRATLRSPAGANG